MPYVDGFSRSKVMLEGAHSPGELNYEITVALTTYLNRMGLTYQTINDVLGALEGVKAEFYRRVAIPYETKKIEENGDIDGYAAHT